MANPGGKAGTDMSGRIQGNALELRGLAKLIKAHGGTEFILNKKMKHYLAGRQATDADVFSRLISKGTVRIGAEAKVSRSALGSARAFAHKLLAYKRELGDNSKFYLIVPNPGNVFDAAKSLFTNRLSQIAGTTADAKKIKLAQEFLEEAVELRVDKLK